MIKAVFFDLYNTLVRYDPPREAVQARALKDLKSGLTPERLVRPLAAADEFIYDQISRGLRQRSEDQRRAVWMEYERIILRELCIEASDETVARLLGEVRNVPSRLVLYDDVLPTVTALRDAGLIIGLITNAERTAHDLMASLGLKPLLNVIITSDEVGFTKPEPQIFRAGLERAGVLAEESVYVGDQCRIDVDGAKSAGMKGILLDRNGLAESAVDCLVIRTLAELPARIAGL